METLPPIYLQPKTIEEALEFASQHIEDFTYLAGGTDVLVNHFQGNHPSRCLIDITGIQELQKVTVVEQTLRVGALIRLDQLKNYPEIRDHFPALIEAANAVGSPLIRKMATLGGNILCENRCIYYNQSSFWRQAADYCLKSGGNICIATGGRKACFSEFVSDTAPALISMEARIEIVDTKKKQIIKLEDIYTGDGMAPINLSKTALLQAIILPLNQDFRSVFKKLRPRKSVDFTSLTTAVTINKHGKLKIVLGGVSPRPVILEGRVNDKKGAFIKEALKQSKTVDNDFYSRLYRREMIRVFLKQSFQELSVD